jgi:hypothetical protein
MRRILHRSYGNVEKSGLEPENTIRKIVVLPIKLFPLTLIFPRLAQAKRARINPRRTRSLPRVQA